MIKTLKGYKEHPVDAKCLRNRRVHAHKLKQIIINISLNILNSWQVFAGMVQSCRHYLGYTEDAHRHTLLIKSISICSTYVNVHGLKMGHISCDFNDKWLQNKEISIYPGTTIRDIILLTLLIVSTGSACYWKHKSLESKLWCTWKQKLRRSSLDYPWKIIHID